MKVTPKPNSNIVGAEVQFISTFLNKDHSRKHSNQTNQPTNEGQPTEEKGDDTQHEESSYEPPPYKPPLPLAKYKLDQQFGKFLEMLKKLRVTIPFTEAITNMPSYAKFLKELLSSRTRVNCKILQR